MNDHDHDQIAVKDQKPATLAKKIEIAANIAILIAAFAVVAFFVRNYVAGRTNNPPSIAAGEKFALKGVDWQSSEKNLVLAVSTTCHFCTESAPFYRTLVDQCRQSHVHVVAVLPQPPAEAQAYLANEGVAVDEIRQSPLADLEVRGTPTLLLVDRAGVVRNVWVGKLAERAEKELISRLSSGSI